MKKLILLSIVFLFIACPPTAKNSARIYIQRGEYEEAREQIRIGLQQSPNDCEYYGLLAKVEIGLGNWVEASRAFQKGVKIDSVRTLNFLLKDQQNIPVYWQAFYNSAITLMGEGKQEEALANLFYCEILQPDNVNQYILQGGIYTELGDIEKSNAAYSKALSIDPENPEAHFLVGQAVFEKRLYDSSLVHFDDAILYFEKKYDRISNVLFQNLPEVTEEITQEIITLWGAKDEAGLDRLIKVKLGFDGGLAAQRRNLENFFKTSEGLARTYYYLGMTYYNLKNETLALENLLKSLAVKGDDIDALYYAGEISLKNKKYDESMEYFTKITKIKEDDIYAWFYMGVNYTQKKDYQKAIDIYENRVLALDPENIDAMTNLAYVYREIGNNKKALEWLTKAEKLQKEQ